MRETDGYDAGTTGAHLSKRSHLDGAFVIALSRSYGYAHRESRKLVAEYGLTFTQFEVLEALLHKGPLTVNSLIEAVLSTSGNITVVVRNLEKRGLIERRENPDDGRSFIVCLTAAGRELIGELFPRHIALLGAALSTLSDDEIRSVIDLLRRLMDAGAAAEEVRHDQSNRP